MPPRPKDFSRLNERVISFNIMLKEFAKEQHFVFVNIYKSFMSHEGPARQMYAIDGLHFSKQGNKKLWQIVSMVVAGH